MWLNAKELAGKEGLPSSEFRTREVLTRLSIPFRSRTGRGGGLEYDCSTLPPLTRKSIGLACIQVTNTALVDAAPVAALPTVRTTELTTPPSRTDKAVADARVQLVNMLQAMLPLNGVKKSVALLSEQLASAQCSADVLATASMANQRARSSAISARTLERWLGIYKNKGWFGLLPAPAAVPTLTNLEADVAQVLGLYHSPDAQWRNLTKAAQHVTKQLNADYDTWPALYSRARRALQKTDAVKLIKARHTGSERAAKLPFKRRNTEVLAPLDVWLVDGHTFKAKVRHPDHGAPFAPEVTLVIDAATRLVCGWSVSFSENVTAVGDALRHAVGNVGVPAIIYSDNGPGETAKQLDCPIAGIVARLGSEHRTGIPGHPQGHGLIERSWRTHMINCARQFGSFQGSDVDEGTFRKTAALLAKEQRLINSKKQTGDVIALSPKAPSWAQFIDAVGRTVADYNELHRHRGLPKNAAGKYMTPAEAWSHKLDPALQHKLGALELRMLFMPATLRVAQRGEVTFLNQHYQAPELMQHGVDGKQVRVHYDIHDPSFVMIFKTNGDFVCEARWNANRIDFFPKPVIEMAREKRVAATIKRREQQIDLAKRELSGTTNAPIAAVLEQSAPVVVNGLLSANGRPFFDTPSARYEWLMQNKTAWTDADNAWIATYIESEDYAELTDYYHSRAMAWPANKDVFKVAR